MLSGTWSIEPGSLRLEWQESGVNLAEREPKRGYGLQLLEVSLPFSLGATTQLDFEPDGVCCSIQLPEHEWRRADDP
jgi:two-component sensor histidine kinase